MATVRLAEHGEGEGADHPPPGTHAVFQLAVVAGLVAAAHHPNDRAGDDQQRVDACGGVDDIGRDAEDRGHGRARLGDDAARPIENGQRRKREQHGEIECGPHARRETHPNEKAEKPEGEGAVALAERTVIAARAAKHRPERTRHLADDCGDHHEHHEGCIHAGDEREGKIERCIGDHVAKLVEHRAFRALHAVLARHHAVDGVERHAQEERHRQKQEGPARVRREAQARRRGRGSSASAASVTPLAVTPALASLSARGRSSAWKRGLRS